MKTGQCQLITCYSSCCATRWAPKGDSFLYLINSTDVHLLIEQRMKLEHTGSGLMLATRTGVNNSMFRLDFWMCAAWFESFTWPRRISLQFSHDCNCWSFLPKAVVAAHPCPMGSKIISLPGAADTVFACLLHEHSRPLVLGICLAVWALPYIMETRHPYRGRLMDVSSAWQRN